MPFGRNWGEELVAEWLSLEGYLVYTGMPVGSGKGGKGGLRDADAVGVRAKGGGLEIKHVEVGQLWEKGGLKANVQRAIDKFNPNVVNIIQNYMMSKTGATKILNYDKVYVATYCPKTQVSSIATQLQTHNIKFLTVPMLVDILKNLIKNYKPPYKGKSGYRMLPVSLWTLKLLECLMWWRYI